MKQLNANGDKNSLNLYGRELQILTFATQISSGGLMFFVFPSDTAHFFSELGFPPGL